MGLAEWIIDDTRLDSFAAVRLMRRDVPSSGIPYFNKPNSMDYEQQLPGLSGFEEIPKPLAKYCSDLNLDLLTPKLLSVKRGGIEALNKVTIMQELKTATF